MVTAKLPDIYYALVEDQVLPLDAEQLAMDFMGFVKIKRTHFLRVFNNRVLDIDWFRRQQDFDCVFLLFIQESIKLSTYCVEKLVS